MGEPANKLVTWKSWVVVLLTLVRWTGYRLYRDYQDIGGFETVNVPTTLMTLGVGFILAVAVFHYANRPEPGDQS